VSCWQGEIAETFDEAALEALLGAVPEDQPAGELCPWFRTVLVPFVRRVLPRGQVSTMQPHAEGLSALLLLWWWFDQH